MGSTLRAACLLSTILAAALPAQAQTGAAGAAQPILVELAYVRQVVPRVVPQSFLEPPPANEGVRGAQLALEDNRTTGRFVGQDWRMHEVDADAEDEPGLSLVEHLPPQVLQWAAVPVGEVNVGTDQNYRGAADTGRGPAAGLVEGQGGSVGGQQLL